MPETYGILFAVPGTRYSRLNRAGPGHGLLRLLSIYPDQYPDLSIAVSVRMQCPANEFVSASELLMSRIQARTPSPTLKCQVSEKPTDVGHPQRHLKRMVSPTQSSSRLTHGSSVLAWTHTWSGSIGEHNHELCISGEIASSASGRTNTITGFSSTLKGSELRESAAMILEQLEASAALVFEACPLSEWKWAWEWVAPGEQ